MNPHLTLLLVYSAAQIALGLWIGRAVRTTGDFFVAGRRLPAFLLFSTMLAANIGAGSTVGAASLGYRDGLSAWWWNGSAGLGSLVLAFWAGPRLWRIARDHGFLTLGDFLEHRYGPAVRGVAAGLMGVATLTILAAQLIGIATILEVVAGQPRWVGAAVGGAVITVYFVAGGLLSSAWVNLVQLGVKLVGFAVAVPIAVAAAGGIEAIRSAPGLPADFFDFLHGGHSGLPLLALLGPAFVVSPGLRAEGLRRNRCARNQDWRWGQRRGAARLRLLPAPSGNGRAGPPSRAAVERPRPADRARSRPAARGWRSRASGHLFCGAERR